MIFHRTADFEFLLFIRFFVVGLRRNFSRVRTKVFLDIHVDAKQRL